MTMTEPSPEQSKLPMPAIEPKDFSHLPSRRDSDDSLDLIKEDIAYAGDRVSIIKRRLRTPEHPGLMGTRLATEVQQEAEITLVERARFREFAEIADILLKGRLYKHFEAQLYHNDKLKNKAENEGDTLTSKRLGRANREILLHMETWKHLLRDWLLSNADSVSMDQVRSWTSDATGDDLFNKKELGGMRAEVGVSDFLKSQGIFSRSSFPKEDLFDYTDLFINYRNKIHKVDVKIGPAANKKPGIIYIEVEGNWFEDFKLRPEYYNEVLAQIDEQVSY